jgi:ribosome-associated protein
MNTTPASTQGRARSWHGEIPEREFDIRAVRSQGAGGQNVNKVASAAHLRFNIRASGLPDYLKQRLLASSDRRVTVDGYIVIKAQRYRTLDKNRADAIVRLHELVRSHARIAKRRVPTRPGKAAKEKRLRNKSHRSVVKQNRRAGLSD